MTTAHLGPCPDVDNSRLFSIAFLRYFMRIWHMNMVLFDGDVELAIISQAVGIISVEELLKDPERKKEFRALSTLVGLDRQTGTNALTIADATGLPRETVRRKMQQLVKLGILVKRGTADFVLKPGAIQGTAFGGAMANVESETLRFVNECLHEGIFKYVPETPDP